MKSIRSEYQQNSELVLVAALFCAWGAIFLARMSGLYLSPFIIQELHLTHAQVALLGSALAISWAFSGLFLGSRIAAAGMILVFLLTFVIRGVEPAVEACTEKLQKGLLGRTQCFQRRSGRTRSEQVIA